MNASYFPTRQAIYTTKPELIPGGDLPNLQTDTVDGPREDLLLAKLGSSGWGRVHHFRNYYSQGWGDRGQGRPLSPRSLEAFYRFLELMPQPRRTAPKVFLTDSGHLELCWTDEAGADVQVEFTPTHTEFYVAATETEDSLPHHAIAELLHLLPPA